MKLLYTIVIVLGALLLTGSSASGQEKVATLRLPVRADSRLWLEGTSNVKGWTCKATAMEALVAVDASSVGSGDDAIVARSLRGVDVIVPVRMLKCGDRHMEANMYDALKAPKLPEMSYIIADFEIKPAQGDDLAVTAIGKMSVAGVERAVSMTVKTERLPDGTRRARGTVPIKMTDFGIVPPRPWFGVLRTADKVLVQFEIYVSPQALASAQRAAASARVPGAPPDIDTP
ncbi:MAG TPA: YceI family protein [Gemmatimonadaceae bacterium]|jgi:polyisoprenoid-binding protein YceI|nr:YceI family protein [Gemmatimonadaceae bacterium]